MFGLFNKKKPGVVTVTLNARLQPAHRHELEDAFSDICARENRAMEIVGGGTALADNGEVHDIDIEIEVDDISKENIDFIEFAFTAMLAPKGSRLSADGERRTFGSHEGLALYLNGTDLPTTVYAECDVGHVMDECERLLTGIGLVNSWWEGERETGLYMYGTSFQAIHEAIKPLLDTYPLCAQARVVQIA